MNTVAHNSINWPTWCRAKEFLEQQGLGDREEGDLGPVYGFQWRHFGAVYKGMNEDYSGQGVDQLAAVIHQVLTVYLLFLSYSIFKNFFLKKQNI